MATNKKQFVNVSRYVSSLFFIFASIFSCFDPNRDMQWVLWGFTFGQESVYTERKEGKWLKD